MLLQTTYLFFGLFLQVHKGKPMTKFTTNGASDFEKTQMDKQVIM